MINYNFKLNWLKILTFNSNVDIWNESEEFDEIVRIPLTPIQINASLLYYYSELLYPHFINDQQNIIDVIISDDGKQLMGLYLYETKKAGIHEPFRKLSNKIIIYQEKDLENFDEFFNKLQMILLERENIRISTIRLFKESAIELINTQCIDIENITPFEFLQRFTNFIQTLFENDLFYIYPAPNIYLFAKDCIKLLAEIKLPQLFEFLYEILPEFNNTMVISSKNNNTLLKLQKLRSRDDISKLTVDINSPKEIGIDFDSLEIKEGLKHFKSKLDTEQVYFVKLDNMISLLSDLFDLKIPLVKQNLLLFMQKAFFAYRSYDTNWYMYPRPKVYNPSLRLLARLFGINLNLKKLSHWAIPEILSNSFMSYFGLNSKILVLLTDIQAFPNLNPKKEDFLNDTFKAAIILEFENSSLKKIRSVKKDEIINKDLPSILSDIRDRVSNKYGYLSAVINIDKQLLKKIIKNFIFDLSKFNPLAKYLVFRALKKSYYFNMYPEMPPFKIIKEKGVISLLKAFLPILIDKHEF